MYETNVFAGQWGRIRLHLQKTLHRMIDIYWLAFAIENVNILCNLFSVMQI